MKKIYFSFFGAFILTLSVLCQGQTLKLTFTADNNGAYIQLDSIKVMNRTQAGDTVLNWPDTVLAIDYVGIHDIPRTVDAFYVYQNYPNPVSGQTTISLLVPERDRVSILCAGVLGGVMAKYERILERGIHTFRFDPGTGGLYLFTANWRDSQGSIKVIQSSNLSHGAMSLEYLGSEAVTGEVKAGKYIRGFSFSPGDELLYIGYAGGLQSGIPDDPEADETYTFQYATNISCPGTPVVEYLGKVYNTIQVFSQCWLKENLDAGTMIPVSQEMTDNGLLEKYCYDDEADSCSKYGGLYQWDEMMQYVNQEGARGICPPGWHVPTDEEWKVLEGAVDSQYKIGDPMWDLTSEERGFDASTNLKTTSGWYQGGNGSDLFGLSFLPGGIRHNTGFYDFVGKYGYWRTSTESSTFVAWRRNLVYFAPWVERYDANKMMGYSVRCLKDQ